MTTASLPTLDGACALTHLGVIGVAGADASHFLQGQLTQDFAQLDLQQARLAAYLNPKGRMLASLMGLRLSADEILLIIPRELLAATLKRLSMFVLRAKAQLRDASADYQLWGLIGSAASARIACDLPPWSRRADAAVDTAAVVQLYPANGQQRALWLAPSSAAAPTAAALELALWHWSEVRSGVATLSAPLVEAFVPQMLNYESIGGVNFQKGCYPGQEVVARSQFRGTLKRRSYLFHAASDITLTPGMEVFLSADSEQAVGQVVQAAAAPGGGWDALLSMQISAADQPLQVAGQPLTPLPLPYALLTDI